MTGSRGVRGSGRWGGGRGADGGLGLHSCASAVPVTCFLAACVTLNSASTRPASAWNSRVLLNADNAFWPVPTSGMGVVIRVSNTGTGSSVPSAHLHEAGPEHSSFFATGVFSSALQRSL